MNEGYIKLFRKFKKWEWYDDINTKTLRYEITQFCDCLFGNNGHNLDTILSCNSRDILDKIRLILNRYYYVRIYLHDPLKNNTELYSDRYARD